MIPPVQVFTPYSSYHVSYRAPNGVTWSWKANHRSPTMTELVGDLRAIADDIEQREAAALVHLDSTQKEKARAVGLRQFEKSERERVKKERAEWIAKEQDWFRRGGLKDLEGNIIQEPHE